jgi:hypothetical protein
MLGDLISEFKSLAVQMFGLKGARLLEAQLEQENADAQGWEDLGVHEWQPDMQSRYCLTNPGDDAFGQAVAQAGSRDTARSGSNGRKVIKTDDGQSVGSPDEDVMNAIDVWTQGQRLSFREPSSSRKKEPVRQCRSASSFQHPVQHFNIGRDSEDKPHTSAEKPPHHSNRGMKSLDTVLYRTKSVWKQLSLGGRKKP